MKHVYCIFTVGQAEDAWFAHQSATSQEEMIWPGFTGTLLSLTIAQRYPHQMNQRSWTCSVWGYRSWSSSDMLPLYIARIVWHCSMNQVWIMASIQSKVNQKTDVFVQGCLIVFFIFFLVGTYLIHTFFLVLPQLRQGSWDPFSSNPVSATLAP